MHYYHFLTPPQMGGGCFFLFLSTAMISYVGKLGLIPRISQTAVSFSIRDFKLFLDADGVSCKLVFCCGWREGQDLVGLIESDMAPSLQSTLGHIHQLTE